MYFYTYIISSISLLIVIFKIKGVNKFFFNFYVDYLFEIKTCNSYAKKNSGQVVSHLQQICKMNCFHPECFANVNLYVL